MKINNFVYKDNEVGIRKKLQPYSEIMENFTHSYILQTDHDIIVCDLSFDSTRILVIMKENDECYIVNQYDADDFNMVFTHKIEGNYIKASKIIQNKYGRKFCVPYLKDGTFNLLIFNKTEVLDDFNINENLQLNNSTRPNDNFPYPMMDACFI